MNDRKFISTNNKIVSRIQSSLPGSIVFAQDFLSEGSPEAIRQQLSRLAKDGLLIRLSHGIYVIPKKFDGRVLLPAGEEIALAIARRDKARVMPNGVVSIWKLGLSTQVPLNYVYLTDGPSRLIKVAASGMKGYTIRFKHASPKNFALHGKISSQVVSALKSLGERNLKMLLKK
jgi:predicted transcriptional regulator of viral defense system